MHPEVLGAAQRRLLPRLIPFVAEYGLVGGTAIALHLGHRRSVDFDLFTNRPLRRERITSQLSPHRISRVLVDNQDEYSVVVGEVKCTFFRYPFRLTFPLRFERSFPLADLLTLAALKAYVLGRRAKWKDYVDLFFILRDRHPLPAISRQAKRIFGRAFNEKLFRVQLAYYRDLDRSEAVDYLPGQAVSDQTIKRALRQWSVS